MKRLFTLCLPFFAAALSWAAPTDLGRVMFVGDSITHGFQAASYRWPLHRILVDNGVRYTEVGVTQGNYHSDQGVKPGTEYRGVPFLNRHSAMSNERAYEVSGRINKSGRLGNTNIRQWLGLDKGYQGEYRIDPATEMPDVFVLLIGTNDTLGDCLEDGIGRHIDEKYRQLLVNKNADMPAIIAAMRRANPNARILVLSLPPWYDGGRHNNAEAADFMAVMMYNMALRAWCGRQKVQFVDVTPNLIDPARTDKIGVSAADLFNASDKVHPSAQGERLIADAVAHALGVSGGTGGLPRGAASSVPFRYQGKEMEGALLLPPGQTLESPAVGEGDFTCSFSVRVGNGQFDRWQTEHGLCVEWGGAQLEITENAVKWQGRVLCVGDMGRIHRFTLAVGESGAFVWMGDSLLAENLSVKRAAKPVRFRNEGRVHAQLSDLAVDSQQAMAPLEGTAPKRQKKH